MSFPEECQEGKEGAMTDISSAELKSTLSLAGGHILASMKKLAQTDGWMLAQRVDSIIHWQDLILLLLVALLTRPLLLSVIRRPSATVVADLISQAAWLAMLVYAVDIVVVTLMLVEVLDIQRWSSLSMGVAKILYTVWFASLMCVYKHHLLQKWTPRLLWRAESRVSDSSTDDEEEEKLQKKHKLVQKIVLVDKAVDVAIYICTGFVLFDVLDVELGVGLTSVFAFGSLGTVVVGLASKDAASMFLNGIVLGLSNRVQEGDYVEFGDGTNGKIVKLGWMQVVIQHYDNTVEVIPNSVLGMQRVINLSRATHCQLKVTLRFKYEDAHKLTDVCQSILEEIKAASPLLVSDGSKPLRAHVSGFQDYYVQVDINTHYHCPPFGDVYWDNRHKVMMAIHQAVSGKHCIACAHPPALASLSAAHK